VSGTYPDMEAGVMVGCAAWEDLREHHKVAGCIMGRRPGTQHVAGARSYRRIIGVEEFGTRAAERFQCRKGAKRARRKGDVPNARPRRRVEVDSG
jgi:hypothetical protein